MATDNFIPKGLEGEDLFTFSRLIEPDSDCGAPWDGEDGHGPVSEWTTRAKAPGEIVLASDRGRHRFYDMAAAVAIARRDGWGSEPFDVPGETAGQKAARAAQADFERLKAWCDDQWSYVGVVVTVSRECVLLGSASLWGIESDAGAYFDEVAHELASGALDDAKATLARLCDCPAP